MPTPVAHSLLGLLFYREGRKHLGTTPVFTVCVIVVLSTLPDYDYVLWFVQPGLTMVHRLFTHSVCFVIAAAAVIGMVARLAGRRFSRCFVLALALGSLHLVLDVLGVDTNPGNGIGIPLLQPFSVRLFSLPLQGVLGIEGSDAIGVRTLLIDEAFFILMFLGVLGILKLIRPGVGGTGGFHANRNHE